MADDMPFFIAELLDDDGFASQDIHFWLVNVQENKINLPEQIGALSHMVAAHSLVFRKMLEKDHLWYDNKYSINMSPFTSQTWKQFLGFLYGHHHLNARPIPSVLELLAISQHTAVSALKTEALKKITKDLAAQHVCLVLSEPFGLKINDFQLTLQNLIFENTKTILNSEELHLITPDSMKFILFLQSSGQMKTASYAELWRIILQWARARAFKRTEMPPEMQPFLNPQRVEPIVSMQRLCARNMIRLVEKYEKQGWDKELIEKMMYRYHTIPQKPPYKLYMCSQLHDKRRMDHELFNVTVVADSGSWAPCLNTKESVLLITVADVAVELFAVVCSGLRMTQPEVTALNVDTTKVVHNGVTLFYHKEQVMYNVDCTAKLSVKVGRNYKKRSDFLYYRKAVVNENILIPFRDLSGDKLILEKNTTYKLEMGFDSSHPLWFEMAKGSRVEPAVGTELKAVGGPVLESTQRGSHVKFVLYKPLTPAKSEPVKKTNVQPEISQKDKSNKNGGKSDENHESELQTANKEEVEIRHEEKLEFASKAETCQEEKLVSDINAETCHKEKLLSDGSAETLHEKKLETEGKAEPRHEEKLEIDGKAEACHEDKLEANGNAETCPKEKLETDGNAKTNLIVMTKTKHKAKPGTSHKTKVEAYHEEKLETDGNADTRPKEKLETDGNAEARHEDKLEADGNAETRPKEKLETDGNAETRPKEKLETDGNAEASHEEKLETNDNAKTNLIVKTKTKHKAKPGTSHKTKSQAKPKTNN